jgi:glycosyltransferase involved in cell wall biosynthesis
VVPATRPERRALRRDLGSATVTSSSAPWGALILSRNLSMLVAGLKSAEREIPSLRGLLVGDGPVFAKIRALIHRGPMRERIHLRRDAAGPMHGSVHPFLLQQRTSMALLEAIAAGVPVRRDRGGRKPEIVLANQTGGTVRSGATDALIPFISRSSGTPSLNPCSGSTSCSTTCCRARTDRVLPTITH